MAAANRRCQLQKSTCMVNVNTDDVKSDTKFPRNSERGFPESKQSVKTKEHFERRKKQRKKKSAELLGHFYLI